MAKSSNNVVEAHVVELDDDGLNENRVEKDSHFVIKVLAEKEMSFTTIKSALIAIWGKSTEVEITEIGRNKVLASFKDKRKGYQLWRGGPWTIKGHLVNMKAWGGDDSVYDIKHDKLQFWVQFHGVPKKHLSQYTGKKLGEEIGEVCEVEDPIREGSLVRHFLRARILVDIAHPLPVGCWIRVGGDSRQWVDFKYEKLFAGFCLKCGIIGHSGRDCKNQIALSETEPGKPKYSKELGVNRPRAIHMNHIYGLSDGSEDDNNIQDEDDHEIRSGCSPGNQESKGKNVIIETRIKDEVETNEAEKEEMWSNNSQGNKQNYGNNTILASKVDTEASLENQSPKLAKQDSAIKAFSLSSKQNWRIQCNLVNAKTMVIDQSINLQAENEAVKQYKGEAETQLGNQNKFCMGNKQLNCADERSLSLEDIDKLEKIEKKYIVELPEEDQTEENEEESDTVKTKEEEKIWEQELVAAVSTRLTLKRLREYTGPMLLDNVAFNEDGIKGIDSGKRRKLQHDVIMAEEAGLIMPHLQP